MRRKVTPEMEERILKLLATGMYTYDQILRIIESEFGVKLSAMSISYLKGKIKKYMTKDFLHMLQKEQEVDINLKRTSLSRCLEIALELSEKTLQKLREKEKKSGLTRQDIRLMNEIVDRLIRIRASLSAEVVVTKETFPTEYLKKKYRIKKTI